MGSSESNESAEYEDSIQKALTTYAENLTYESLAPAAIEAAKIRIIDTFGTLVYGFHGEASELSRKFATRFARPDGCAIVGTELKVDPDLAAFVNSTAARDAELNDSYSPGHPSDALMGVFAAAEYAHASGKDLILGVILAYEATLRFSDATKIAGWDFTTLTGIGTVLGAAKVLGLSYEQTHHALAMHVIPNNALWQTRTPDAELSMWKALAAGQAGRAGVFAALLARDGMEGPQWPFEGSAGWLEEVAHSRFQFDLAEFGGNGNQYKIEQSIIKVRGASARTISSILAAEDAHTQLKGPDEIEKVTVEVYNYTLKRAQSPAWNPTSREAADHSIPYVVAAALLDGTITPRQFDDEHLKSPQLHEIMSKIEVVENLEFTKDYETPPRNLHTRVNVVKKDGGLVVGDGGDWAAPRDGRFIEDKFAGLNSELLSEKQMRTFLDRMWALDQIDDVAEIPSLLVL